MDLIGTQMPVSFVKALFSVDSLILRSRLTHCKDVLSEMLKVVYVIMHVKSVPFMEESYRFVWRVPSSQTSVIMCMLFCVLSDMFSAMWRSR